jgi:hypothetical protein
MDQTQQRDFVEEHTVLGELRAEAEAEAAAEDDPYGAAMSAKWQRQAAGAIVAALVPGWELISVEKTAWGNPSTTVRVSPDGGRSTIEVHIETRINNS